jgi:membrane protease YdiL (CAAX protease family)
MAEDDAEKPATARRRILVISAENALTSLLFAAGHVLIPIGGVLMISRASVFFPSLAFGWLRERTGSIVAPVIYHAAANMMVLLAAPHFF